MAARPKKAPAEFAIPPTFGACADLLYQTRQARLDQQKVVEDLEKRETMLREHIINNLPKSDGGAVGKVARVELGSKTVARVHDWDAFWKYVFRTKDTSLLQRRVGEAAIQERWDAKKEVPGVEPFTVVTLSVKKV